MGRLMLLMIFRLIIYKKMVVLCVVKLCTESAFDSLLSSVVVNNLIPWHLIDFAVMIFLKK